MREPQEIHDEEYEQVAERVAAVDVATASGMVCTRVPHPSQPGRRLTKVWEVEATTGAIIELGGHLAGLGVEKVTVESHLGLLARVLVPAGGGWPGGAVGQRP
jgi:transposase